MFSTSTHRKYWMLEDENKVKERRNSAHDAFVERSNKSSSDASKNIEKFLSFDEADLILRFFERQLMNFCNRFKPPMPKAAIGTTFTYFKRFYLNNSVMDYHPKEILVTAAYLACKVEEFNVSIEQFISNIQGNKERATDVILNTELLLMQELNFHLSVHNPYRAVEGILVDVKTRFSNGVINIEALRPHIEKFLNDINYTNAGLIYAPSQIALAAVIHAASKGGQNMDVYVTDVLLGGDEINDDDEKTIRLKKIIGAVRNVRLMVKNIEPASSLDMNNIKRINERLEKCRNQENNPDSQAYKQKMQEMLEDEEDRKRPKLDVDAIDGIHRINDA